MLLRRVSHSQLVYYIHASVMLSLAVIKRVAELLVIHNQILLIDSTFPHCFKVESCCWIVFPYEKRVLRVSSRIMGHLH